MIHNRNWLLIVHKGICGSYLSIDIIWVGKLVNNDLSVILCNFIGVLVWFLSCDYLSILLECYVVLDEWKLVSILVLW